MAKHDKGDTARQMAAAPLSNTGADVQAEVNGEQPQQDANRFRQFFGAVTFKAAKATEPTYTDDRSGRKSKKLADVTVLLANGAGYCTGKISAVQNGANSKPVAEFGFMAQQFKGQAIRAVDSDPTAEAELAEWKAGVVDDYLRWRKEIRSTPTAAARQPIDSTRTLDEDVF